MKLTIINSDKAVYLDGLSYSNLELTVPSNIHALQWDTDKGHIEFVNCVQPNELIEVLPEWAEDAITKWQNAYDLEQSALNDIV